MRTIDEINAELRSVWGRFFPGLGETYSPMLYQAPHPDALVFVGMNPSLSSIGWESILRRSTVPGLDPHAFFQWPSPQDFNVELAHTLEALAREHYPFFAPHRALADALQIEWNHFDLFAYRETAQRKMSMLALSNSNDIELTEFGCALFKLFEELLCLSQPAAVIVVNSLASQIYLKRRAPSFNSLLGYHQDSFSNGHQFPVFFSGMLTGARALDRFSKDRLFWQVANALGKSTSLGA